MWNMDESKVIEDVVVYYKRLLELRSSLTWLTKMVYEI